MMWKVLSPPWFLRCVSCPFWGLGAPLSISCGPNGLFICGAHVSASFWVLPESHLSSEEAIFLWVQLFLTFHSPNLGFSAMPLGSAVDILATDDPNFTPDDQQDTQIYEKHDNLLHGVKKKK